LQDHTVSQSGNSGRRIMPIPDPLIFVSLSPIITNYVAVTNI
jgi:hypothetical protein